MKRFLLCLFFISLLVSSCTPQGTRNTRTQGTNTSTTDDIDTSDEIEDITDLTLSWIANGTTVQGTVTQNADSTSSIYLQGSALNNYIENNSLGSTVMCLVTNYRTNSGLTTNRQLRLRAIPTKLTSTGQYVLRVDTSTSQDNQSFCAGDNIPFYEASGNISGLINTTTASYTYSEVCPTCTLSLSSFSTQLYKSENGSITAVAMVPNTSIDLAGLGIKLDTTSNSNDVGGSCTDLACQGADYDCCLDGQCVKDKEIRDNVDPTQMALALQDVYNNEENYKRWPTVFYVCQNNTPGDGDDDDDSTGDPTDDANQRLAADILDYECLQGTTASCSPDLSTVQQRTWQKCGCLLDPMTNDPLDPRCPDYTLEAELDESSGEITKIVCKIPPVVTDPAPFQNLDININARRAPHRYYSVTGTNYSDLSDAASGDSQEGEAFSYLDDVNKVSPNDTSFSMNAIIGQMSLSLDQALPAKEIDVEMDQTYIISGVSGYFSPCPTCQKDSWYSSFTSAPSVNSPHGLSWKGYTTTRDEYSNNDTSGNYEDMIFNRACWLPPTMIPSSHKSYSDTNTQRQNRLATQAAYFVNGYQRDWFGFNKGALIASFDGVTWFAVGNGRRVRSTTKKLFLAINAPYADLTDPTSYNITVVQDLGGQSASDHDYNYDLLPTDSSQNPGASCQYQHSCNVDSDCVAKLGWEYACADVNDIKTNWPRFDVEGAEKENDGLTASGLDQILAGGINNSNIKRCVYRGAGSLCKLNYESTTGGLDDLSQNEQKLLRCAPNFYCAGLDTASFNSQVKRSPNDATNILFGQGSNILGRPKTYVGASDTLSAAIVSNIVENAKGYLGSATSSDFGLCVPGKKAGGTETQINRHAVKDSGERTDFISQVASCDSSATGLARVSSCPAFDSEGNYDMLPTSSILHNQNQCGAESYLADGSESSFKDIELDSLPSLLTILTPSVTKDACFRRAGSVCHTDLDCSPNKLHAQTAESLSQTDFGDTLAELNFWKEELVCGQSAEEPLLSNSLESDYYGYDMGANRCCREVTKDFTMYTQLTPGSNHSGYDSDNDNLDADQFAYNDPKATGRYSRYAVSDSSTAVSIPETGNFEALQWETINDTGSQTCCGGGFIRKFEDGTTNWTNTTRLQVSPSNFSCINYKNDLYKQYDASVDKDNWNYYYNSLCLFPGTERSDASGLIGCIQESITSEFVNSSLIAPSTFTSPTGLIYSTKPDADSTGSNISVEETYPIDDHIYHPAKVYTNAIWSQTDRESGIQPNASEITNELMVVRDPADFLGDSVSNNDTLIALTLPAYMPASNITNVELKLRDGENADIGNAFSTGTQVPGCSVASIKATDGWCVAKFDGRDVLLAHASSDGVDDPDDAIDNWQWGFLHITFNGNFPAGAMNPGSDLFYLDKLSRFELLGVPQIGYEPIFCNDGPRASDLAANGSDDNQGLELVDGLFNFDTQEGFRYNSNQPGSSVNPAADRFSDIDINAGDTTIEQPRVFYKEDGTTIDLPKVFAANDFKCCSKLGSNVSSASRCCSGFGSSNSDGGFTCKLPKGANINLYINKFISSEAQTIDESLAISDYDEDSSGNKVYNFDPETGFPVYTPEVTSKVMAIGNAHCANAAVKSGNAFGYYPPAPTDFSYAGSPEIYYSLIDSPLDFDQEDPSRGYSTFIQGYRWNHHIYCD